MTIPAVQPQDQHANFEKARYPLEEEGLWGDRRDRLIHQPFTSLSAIRRKL
jgi:hypothetical protein